MEAGSHRLVRLHQASDWGGHANRGNYIFLLQSLHWDPLQGHLRMIVERECGNQLAQEAPSREPALPMVTPFAAASAGVQNPMDCGASNLLAATGIDQAHVDDARLENSADRAQGNTGLQDVQSPSHEEGTALGEGICFA